MEHKRRQRQVERQPARLSPARRLRSVSATLHFGLTCYISLITSISQLESKSSASHLHTYNSVESTSTSEEHHRSRDDDMPLIHYSCVFFTSKLDLVSYFSPTTALYYILTTTTEPAE